MEMVTMTRANMRDLGECDLGSGGAKVKAGLAAALVGTATKADNDDDDDYEAD
jgi:hypothetical protein